MGPTATEAKGALAWLMSVADWLLRIWSAVCRSGPRLGTGSTLDIVTYALADTSTGDGEPVATVARGASERSAASPAVYVAAHHVPAPHLATFSVAQPSADELAQSFGANVAPDVADARASPQHYAAPPLATFTNTVARAANPVRAPTYITPAAQLYQPAPDAGIDATMRSASGELPPPPDTAAIEQLAARMDEDAAGAIRAWLPCAKWQVVTTIVLRSVHMLYCCLLYIVCGAFGSLCALEAYTWPGVRTSTTATSFRRRQRWRASQRASSAPHCWWLRSKPSASGRLRE